MYRFPDEIRRLYESSPLSFVYYQNIDHRAVPVLVSDGFCANTGISREVVFDWLQHGLFGMMHPDDVGVMSQISDDFLHHRGSYNAVFRVKLAQTYSAPNTGSDLDVISLSPTPNESTHPPCLRIDVMVNSSRLFEMTIFAS